MKARFFRWLARQLAPYLREERAVAPRRYIGE